MVTQSSLDTTLFDITPINPDLVNSIDQVYLLRQTLLQFFCNQRSQELIFTDEVERARSIVAITDVLWRSGIEVKVVILSATSKVLEQIKKSFEIHTSLPLNSLSILDNIEKTIHFIQYQSIEKKFNPKETENFFNQFNLIISDDLENEKFNIIRRRLKYHRAWLLNTKTLQTEQHSAL